MTRPEIQGDVLKTIYAVVKANKQLRGEAATVKVTGRHVRNAEKSVDCAVGLGLALQALGDIEEIHVKYDMSCDMFTIGEWTDEHTEGELASLLNSAPVSEPLHALFMRLGGTKAVASRLMAEAAKFAESVK